MIIAVSIGFTVCAMLFLYLFLKISAIIKLMTGTMTNMADLAKLNATLMTTLELFCKREGKHN